MRAELIAVGTELLLGNIANTDGQYLSQRLAERGIDVLFHSVVGDNKVRLQNALRLALSRSDIVILSGGLGPTTDDITKETVAELLSLSLEEHAPTLKKITEYYARVGREMTDLAKKQALIPHGAIVFENDCGTAPGLCIEGEKQSILLLPGPPRELEAMFEKSVAPYLKRFSDGIIHSSSVFIVGHGEPWVEERVGELVKSENPTFALYAKEGEVQIRVTAKASSRADAVKIVKNGTDKLCEIFGDEIYGIDTPDIQTAVVDLLCENEKTVTTAESLTGGLVAQKITAVSGASNVFKQGFSVYCDDAKHRLLGVPKKVLKKNTAVSEQTAVHMALGALKATKSDYAIATTGVAGPGADDKGHPAGLVFVAVADKQSVWVKKLMIGHGEGERAFVREVTAKNALDMLRRMAAGSETAFAIPHKTATKKGFSLDAAEKPEKKPFLKRIFPQKGDSARAVFKKLAAWAVVLLLLAALAVAGISGGARLSRVLESRKLMEVYNRSVVLYDPLSPVNEEGRDTRLDSLCAINPDTAAWLSIEGTDIAFPIVKGEGYDLKNFWGEAGATPFLDSRCDVSKSGQNLLIRSTAVPEENAFYDLLKYSGLSYYKNHPTIDMVSVAGESRWKIFAVFVASVDETRDSTFEYYNYTNFLNEDELFLYVDEVRSRSLINAPVDIREGDTLMTISIPCYEFEGAQFVVVARKYRRAEVSFKESAQATNNLAPLFPDEWYEANGGEKPDLSLLIGANDVMQVSSEENVEAAPVSSEIVSSEMSSVEETSSGSTSHEISSDVTSSEETSSEEPSSEEEPSSSEASSSRPTSSRETSSAVSSRPASSATSSDASSRPTSSEAVSSETSSAPDEDDEPIVDGTQTLSVYYNGKLVTSSAFDIVSQIVANEVGNSSPTEATKAQAVAAHTYVLYYNSIGQIPSVGLKTPSTAVKNAVASVIDEKIYYNNSLILACYSSMCAGRTNASEEVWGGAYPYLVSVESEYDYLATGYRSTKQFSEQYIKDIVKSKLGITLSGDPNTWFEVVTLTSGGYNGVVSVGGQNTYINSSGKRVSITGRYLRESVLSLRSAAFDVHYDKSTATFTFTTYGYGHGVGMSQWGAIYYAQKAGWDYKDILTHYFTGCKIR